MDVQTLALFFIAALTLLLGFAGEAVFRKTRIPEVIWLILFGVLLSLFLPAADKAVLSGLAAPFGTLALIMILFDAGMSFDLAAFSKSVGRGALLTIIAFIITVSLTTAFATLALGWPLLYGVLLGAILGDASQAVIIPLAMRMRIPEGLKSVLTIETTLTDIFVIVTAVTVMGMISTGTMDLTRAFGALAYAIAVGLIIAVVGAFAWLSVESAVERRVHSHFLAFAILLLLYVLTEALGGFGMLTALIFGLALGNIPEIRQRIRLPQELHLGVGVKNFYSDIDFFMRTFFFVYLGALFVPSDLLSIGIGAALVAILFFGRIAAVFIALAGTHYTRIEKELAVSMMSRGLTSAVAAQLPAAALTGVAASALTGIPQITLAVIFFSVLANVAGVSVFPQQGCKKGVERCPRK